MKIIFAIVILSLLLSGCGNLGAVLAYNSEVGAQRKEMAVQQNNFNRIKSALERNKLVKDSTPEYMRSHYGEPVVIMDQQDSKRWVYKPGSTKMGTEKIYLYFKDDKLTGWEYLPAVQEQKDEAKNK